MKEFYPWSKTAYEEAIAKYKEGRLSILDVQLSGKCNYNCTYCDSPNRDLPCKIDFDHLEILIRKEPPLYQWMFICGLGEPLWAENKPALLKLLALCRELKIKCSFFTNGSHIDEQILDYVHTGILYPIIKIDTFSHELSKEIYNTPESHKTLKAMYDLFDIANDSKSEFCHVAASIVPTRKNFNEMTSIVHKCLENNVFPLLGQLEYAGNAIGNYDSLLLSREELLRLKSDISNAIGEEYKVPICPSVIAGIHIANDGWVSVDRRSGLSCSWFWLETPQTVKLCDVNAIGTFSEADRAIIEYRKKVIRQMIELTKQIEIHPFGGCGGNVRDLAEEYVKLQISLMNEG
jgi:MoaA/NifB/PqqE/SkfB family radical SAM enzyme